ncbi:MAG: hypothetical protein M1480_06625 [Bacteroidetes bacterium]|nr:hypothetical protein [Bacteroidota bacterium]
MVRLELNMTGSEIEAIVDTLEECISDLNMEIADTEQMEYREELKNKRVTIRKFINLLKEKELATNN